jgi:hypothetical protein
MKSDSDAVNLHAQHCNTCSLVVFGDNPDLGPLDLCAVGFQVFSNQNHHDAMLALESLVPYACPECSIPMSKVGESAWACFECKKAARR